MRGPIISPRLGALLRPRFFTSIVRITAADPTATPTSYGEPGGTPGAVSGCEAVPCTSPQRAGAVAITEAMNSDGTPTRHRWGLMLAGEYRAIEERMIATVDGIEYNIVSVDHVSCGGFTQLTLERTVV